MAAIKPAWPGAADGSVLITTRDLAVATTIAADRFQVDALSDVEGSKMLLRAMGTGDPSPSDKGNATAISRVFGGLPLALAQVGGFASLRKLSLKDVLPLYERYSTKIDARKAPGTDYEHTLSTVWDVSFEKLTETSTALLYLLSFFEPDNISEDILLEGSQGLGDEFRFLSDELE